MTHQINFGQKSSSLTGEEVVISGISGLFPNSTDVVEFMENLYNKVDMVVNSQCRWDFKHPELPKCVGTIKGMEKFDAQFFRVHPKQATVMEPMCRKLLEHTYGAMYDAGYNPMALKNTKVGIYLAPAFTGAENIIYEVTKTSPLSLPGMYRAMYANRISYWMDSKAPSYATDLGCASALACLQHAYRSINAGECESAIVGGANFCNHPAVSINLKRCGLLCLDGKTKCYDKNGDGYVRSDAVSVFFLQKAKHAKRIYCEVYNIKGCYNAPPKEFLPIHEVAFIKNFLEDFYASIGVDPNNVEYVEGSSVGIAEADSKELEAIGQIYGREVPIKVGSIKSNMGSSEAGSGMCSLTKLCLAYHKGQLSANLHYNNPLEISSVRDGKVQVLTDNTDFNRGFTALNSFSFSGPMYHALLKGHHKEKNNELYRSQIPYLILTSGRQETWMDKQLSLLKCYPLDPELIGLLHGFYQTDTPGHVYRGYTILGSDYRGRTLSLAQSISYYNKTPRPVVFLYSGLGSALPVLSLELMKVPIIAQSMQRSHEFLKSKGFDIMSLLTDADVTTNADILDVMIGVTAMQIAFTDLFYKMGVIPDLIIGHCMGDLICAYADGSLTSEQILMTNFIRRNIWSDQMYTPAVMLAVGLGYEQVKKLCPPEIEIICHNSPNSSTVLGPCGITRGFAEKLKNYGIFVKELNCRNIPFHSTYIAHIESLLTKRLKEVIKDPKPRSPKWLSSSVRESLWNTPAAYFSSAQYHSKSLFEPVLFEETARYIPADAIIIEISPRGQLQSVLKQSHEKATYISLSKHGHNDSVQCLFEAIGRLYETGLNPDVSVMYPAIEYPVSTTTPLLSNFIEWEHSEDWPTNEFKPKSKITSKSQNFIISVEDDDYKYIQGNVRDGKNIFPEASLLVLVWNTLAMYKRRDYKKLSVAFHKVHFHDEVIIEAKKILRFYVAINKGTDKFQVTFENKLVVSGVILSGSDIENFNDAKKISDINAEMLLTKRDVYRLFHLRGYSLKGSFRSIESTTIPVKTANVLWTDGEWATFLDSLIQLNILERDYNGVSVLKYIHNITINVEDNSKINEKNITCFPAQFYKLNRVTRCAGIVMENVLFLDKPVLEHPRVLKGNVNISYAGVPIHRKEFNRNFFDYSGTNKNNSTVMGVVYTSDDNNLMMADPDLLWPVPEYWSLEEAATVPLPYLYAFYCLTIKCSFIKPNSVLVTDGMNAVGQAIVSLCLYLKCTIFTTVNSAEDKVFLLQLFPGLQEENIIHTQEGNLLHMVKHNTQQEGCDVVINTFSGTLKTQAIMCVKKYGLFLILKDYINTQDLDLEMSYLNFNKSYKVIDLASVLISNNSEDKMILQRLISEGIAKGYVRPLNRVVYKPKDHTEAFQVPEITLSQEQKGRILVNMIDMNNQIDNINERVDFGSSGNYVIICDESELGIELTEDLIKRGIKKIILHISVDGFVQLKLSYWKKLNLSIEVCCENLGTKDGCENLLRIRENGTIEGVFIINKCDSKTSKINKTNNTESVDEKTNILNNLNCVSKNVCFDLKYYIIISYTSKEDYENNLISICDMICEERHKTGLPALHYYTGLLNMFDESNEIQSNMNFTKISSVLRDLEKCINLKKITTNVLTRNDKIKDNFVDTVEGELNKRFNAGLKTFFKYIEEDECTGTDVLVNMTTKVYTTSENNQEFDSNEPHLLMIPGFDGNYHIFKILCERLNISAMVLQLTPDLNYSSMKTIASGIMQLLKKQIKFKSKFYILGYSFGVNVALELAALFEQEGHVGIVYCLDSSPDALPVQFQAYVGELSDVELQNEFLNHMYLLFAKKGKGINFENMKWSDKLKRVLDNIKSIPLSNEYKKLVIESAYKKIVLAHGYKPDFKLESELILIRGISHPKASGLTYDYDLSKYTKNPVKIFEISSDLASVPEDCKISDIVNRTLDPKLIEEFKKRNLCETYWL